MSVNWGKVSFFRRSEFDYPDQMKQEIILFLDELRRRCGFPLKVTSDFRTDVEMEAIYGEDRSRWVNSPHQRGNAVDVQPMPNTPMRRFKVIGVAHEMFEQEMAPRLGLEVADRHIHIDVDRVLSRPHFWVGRSR